MELPTHFLFPRDYEVQPLTPNKLVSLGEKEFHYPVKVEEFEGVSLRVTTRYGESWRGHFGQGFAAVAEGKVAHGVWSAPDPASVCVVAGGYAYVVRSDEPQKWLTPPQRPVVEVHAVEEEWLLLFVGFTDLSALGSKGMAWQSERLSSEGVRVLEIAGHELRGVGWDVRSDKEAEFVVDLRNGRVMK